MNLPSIELLKATHTFPGNYLFKIITIHDAAVVIGVLEALRLELGLNSHPPHSKRESENGKHIAISVDTLVASAEQVHGVYHRLLKVAGVVLLL